MAGTPRTLRAMNDRAALDLLLEHGPLSRTRIGKLTGLSKPTASQLLARLEASGLVLATGTSEGRPGPNAQLYEVDPTAAYAAGLDVTPERILAAVADITGRTVGSYELPTPGRRPTQPVVRQVTDALDGAVKAAGLARGDVHRLVIGTPGAFDPNTGRLRYASHLPGWHTPALLDELAAVLPMPVEYENDVNLVAVAEQRLGAARGHEDFVLLWNEGGLGAALVLGGQAAPRLDRRRGGGRFPAGSRSTSGAARHQGQQWWLSGARGLPGHPAPRPRARYDGHPVRAVRRGRRRPRGACRRRGHRPEPAAPADLRHPAGHRSRLARIRPRPRTRRPQRCLAHRSAATPCAPSSRTSWRNWQPPGPGWSSATSENTPCCAAPWRARSRPPATRSSTPLADPRTPPHPHLTARPWEIPSCAQPYPRPPGKRLLP